MSDERRSNDVYTRRAITRVITLPEIIIIWIDRESTSVTVRSAHYVHSWTWCSAENRGGWRRLWEEAFGRIYIIEHVFYTNGV